MILGSQSFSVRGVWAKVDMHVDSTQAALRDAGTVDKVDDPGIEEHLQNFGIARP